MLLRLSRRQQISWFCFSDTLLILGRANSQDFQSEFYALETALQKFHRALPSLLDNEGLERFEVFSLINPRLLIAHTTYHGSVLLLYSISIRRKDGDEGDNDDDDRRSRARVFEAARSLAEIFARIRGARGLRKVRGFVLPIVRDLHTFSPHTSFL